MTFHPGKVLKVIEPKDRNVKSSDDTVQATLEMWDDNIFTFIVEPKISKDVSEGDIVLVDYRPDGKLPVAKQSVVKVLKGKAGNDIWKKYEEFHKKRQKKTGIPMSMPQQPPSYMG